MTLRFALNHMAAPRLDLIGFFRLAASLGITEIEIRNDLEGRPIRDGTSPAAVGAAAAAAAVTILSINALQRFDDWTAEREREAVELTRDAAASGARGLVLVPTNDGSGGSSSTTGRLGEALRALAPILGDHGVVGLVEPLGFTTSSLRSKREAVAAIEQVGGAQNFALVHDTFHHALAGEPELYPHRTALIHISGVSDRSVPLAALRDSHRGLIGRGDRLESVGQIAALLAAGYTGPLSFEPFAAEVHALADPASAIRASMDHLRSRLVTSAI